MPCLRPSSHHSYYGSFMVAANGHDDETDENKKLLLLDDRQTIPRTSSTLLCLLNYYRHNRRLIVILMFVTVMSATIVYTTKLGRTDKYSDINSTTCLNFRDSAFPSYLYSCESTQLSNGRQGRNNHNYDDDDDTALYCQPKRIHLALASNVDDKNHNVSMTVSFSISYEDYHHHHHHNNNNNNGNFDDASDTARKNKAAAAALSTAASCQSAQPQIVYGTGFDAPQTVLADKNKAKQFNYTSDKTTGGVYQSDYIFHVELPNLQAGHVQYWYRIQMVVAPSASAAASTTSRSSNKEDEYQKTTTTSSSRHLLLLRQQQQDQGFIILASSPTFRFRTPPLPGGSQPTRIALVGDLGQTYNSTSTAFHIWQQAMLQEDDDNNEDDDDDANAHLSHLLIAGDMSYADSDPYRWTSWFDLMEPLLRILPVHVAAGNHEVECNTATLDIFVPFENYFYNPNRIRDAEMTPITDDYRQTLWHGSCSSPSQFQGHYVYGNSFYSYIVGLAHVIVLNSYTGVTEGSIQYAWLKDELQHQFNRTNTPWLLVSFHAPLYTTFLGHVNEIEAIQMKHALESLFLQYGVNLVVSGHDHAYMRTHSLAFGHVDPTGASPVYLTLGAGGNREQHSAGYRNEEPEEWVAARSLEDYGFGHLLIPNATHAYFEWVRDGISKTGIQDQVWFTNPHV